MFVMIYVFLMQLKLLYMEYRGLPLLSGFYDYRWATLVQKTVLLRSGIVF